MWEEINKFLSDGQRAAAASHACGRFAVRILQSASSFEPSAAGHYRRHDVARRGLAFRPHRAGCWNGPTRPREFSTSNISCCCRIWPTSARRSIRSSGPRCSRSRQRAGNVSQAHGRITPTQVADFLMLDRQFPRAMHFCLIKAEESLAGNHRQASRGTFRIGRRATPGAACGPSWITRHQRDHRRRPARIHRRLSDQVELGGRSDLGNVLRRPSGTSRYAADDDK